MTILLTDDHPMVKSSLQLCLSTLLPQSTVLSCASFPRALAILDQHKVDLIVLDIMLPGSENTQMVRLIKAKQPSILILMYSGLDENVYALPYIQAGAHGFLSKATQEPEFEKAIRTLLNKGCYVSEDIQHRLVSLVNQKGRKQFDNPLQLLSASEQKVQTLLVEGKWTKEIAAILKLKVSTVSTYKKRIFEKLDVTNTAELIRKVNLFKYL